MPRMVVTRTRPVRYPSGPEGKEYKQGDEFDVATDVEAKRLTMYQAAKLVEDKKKAKVETKAEIPVAKVETAAEEPAAADDARKYRTRAMRAKE